MTQIFDYSECEKEDLIHSGSIQGHGVFACIDETRTITHVSENAELISEKHPHNWLNQPVEDYLNASEMKFLNHYDRMKGDIALLNKARRCGDRDYELVIHMNGASLILEWEPTNPCPNFPHNVLPSSNTLEEPLQFVIKQVFKLAEFDRVLIYKFEDDGTGVVVAEQNKGCPEDLLGLRYPKTDIPQIARDLFLKQHTRMIANTQIPTVDIITTNTETKETNLTFSQLRSVSPYHLSYLKNLNIATSCSSAIIVGKKLWGLIVCQSIDPVVLSYSSRSEL